MVTTWTRLGWLSGAGEKLPVVSSVAGMVHDGSGGEAEAEMSAEMNCHHCRRGHHFSRHK